MEKLRSTYRVVVIIGLAIMATLFLYAVVVSLVENRTIALDGEPVLAGNTLEVVKFVLLGVSVLLFIAIRFVNAKILGFASESGRKTPQRTEAEVSAEFGKLIVAAVISYVLSELPVVFGFVLYILGRNTTDFYLFLLISLFCFAVNFPRYSQWEDWYRRRSGGYGERRAA